MADPTDYKYLWNQLRRNSADMADRAANEIERLKGRVEALEPKAHAYDQLSTVLGLLPQPRQMYGEDLVWRLRNEAQVLRETDDPPVVTPEKL